ncbi:MAG: segregation and condensation protein B [Puniceicoccaceae bacterium 5H]|nr:MAG: segregation and condensation protein B [Puniceicoccaceae bacterium 5H]
MFDLKKTLLALLFSSSEALTIRQIQNVVQRFHEQAESERVEAGEDAAEPGEDAGQSVLQDLLDQVPSLLTAAQIREAMATVSADLEQRKEVWRLVEAVEGYKLVIAPEHADWVRLLRNEPRPRRLSAAQMETLAIVAYRQPVTRAEVEAIRGVSSDNALNRLQERGLVEVIGRADLPGRPMQYGTARAFLEFVGLRSLDELPASDVLSPQQINEWIRRATEPEAAPTQQDLGLGDQ